MGKTRDLFKKIRDTKGTFHAKMGSIKDRNGMDQIGKTTRPFRYDLNQIPFDYTVKVTNSFKQLELTECQKNYGQRFITLCRRQ